MAPSPSALARSGKGCPDPQTSLAAFHSAAHPLQTGQRPPAGLLARKTAHPSGGSHPRSSPAPRPARAALQTRRGGSPPAVPILPSRPCALALADASAAAAGWTRPPGPAARAARSREPPPALPGAEVPRPVSAPNPDSAAQRAPAPFAATHPLGPDCSSALAHEAPAPPRPGPGIDARRAGSVASLTRAPRKRLPTGSAAP